MRTDVAALYVDPRGPYPKLVADWYDEARDARAYAGPWPVVAHPPCGPWGRLRFLCTRQDPSCGLRAVEQVQTFGGVLEHPANSTLFRRCRLPFPWELGDGFGWTVDLRQVAWGHACEKPTWLYCVGIEKALVVSGFRTGGIATHRVASGPRGPQLKSAHSAMRSRTPIAFAEWLLSLAATAQPRARKAGAA